MFATVFQRPRLLQSCWGGSWLQLCTAPVSLEAGAFHFCYSFSNKGWASHFLTQSCGAPAWFEAGASHFSHSLLNAPGLLKVWAPHSCFR